MPWMRRMSCGSGLPSMMYSPLRIVSPSWTAMCLPLGIRNSTASPPSFRGDLDPALVLVVAPELDPAVHFGDDRAILRPTRFEQLRHPRQTAGDVARLGAFGGDTREHVAGLHVIAVADREHGAHRQQVCGRRRRWSASCTCRRPSSTAHGRTQIRTPRGCAPVDDDAVGDAGRFVGFLADATALHQVFEAHLAAHLGDDRGGVRVPLGQSLPRLTTLPPSLIFRRAP